MSARAAGDGDGGRRNTLAKVSLSSLSAATAEAATFPIDAIKTRLQLHRSPVGGGGGGGGVMRVAGELVRDGGIYRGLSPAVVRHLFYTPLRIVGYENLRSTFACGGREAGLLEKALAGGVSGIVAQVVASPADLIKVRMQADSRLLSQGIQPRYTGILDAFTEIIRTEGFRGLWKGVVPNAHRAFLVNMGELACYDQAKHFIIRKQICGDNLYAHTLASVASGLSATTLSCPADVIKTRMMNQGKDAKVMYRNSYDCLVMTVKHEGLTALWKGFLPTWARLGPWQFVFWVSYEKLRQASGTKNIADEQAEGQWNAME
ncbi:mitochondrial uncoupling protein 3 isoform X1 [Oryza brachyantha]|uniref:mitochondrial uncoupling protein 3 isoform X1 n=1 Tax=Oryza brachyantha TaxID=4533 RepID=UPI001AD9E4E1|nr:mitochondrial uncoupling protein 3 isoform X1 [Oryza brachyantha]